MKGDQQKIKAHQKLSGLLLFLPVSADVIDEDEILRRLLERQKISASAKC